MRAREVNRRIEKLGGVMTRHKGSHRIYKVTYGPDQQCTVQTVVAQHRGDMPLGTLKAIERALAPAFGEGWLL